MAKNEAKIRFTAETKNFNSAISQANNEMSELRAEMRLNETQMKATGNTVEGLENKHKILSSQLQAAGQKTEALSQKVEKAVEIFGENSQEASKLRTQLLNAQTAEEKLRQEVDRCSEELENQKKGLNDVDDAAANAGGGFTVMKGAIADLVSQAIQFGIQKISEFVSYLMELPAATAELRQDLATLTTSFDNMGFSTATATDTWKDLYAVFGEDDRAVETANLISKMADNQQDLADWVDITTGIWGTYQDSLPVEGLAEASNETAKTGKVTGVLADALNWSTEAAEMFADYMGGDVVTAEDAFNEALAECTTEEERQALITETLTALYGEAADTYREASGAQMDAKEAAAEHALAEAELASAIEPVTTAFTQLKTELIQSLTPAIEAVSGVAVDALNWMKEHPVAMQAIGAALAVLATGLTIAAVALGVYTVAQWAANAAILANPITWIVIAIIAALAALAAIIVVVVNYWDEIKAAASNALESIKSAWGSFTGWISSNIVEPIKSFFTGLWDSIKSTATSLWDGVKGAFSAFVNWINTNIVQPVVSFFTGLWDSVVSIWNNISNAIQVAIMFIGQVLSMAFQIITLPWMFIWQNVKEYVFAAWEWIKEKISTAINAVKTVITTVMNKVKSVITTVTNTIKNTVTKVWNAIKNTTTTVFNAVKNVITTVWNSIKSTVTTVINAVKTVVTNVWNNIKSVTTTAFNAVKNTVTSIWNSIKNTVSTVVNSVRDTVSSIWDSIKTKTSSVFNSVKSTVTSIWNSIKSAIIDPIETAKSKVESAITAIKNAMNFSWSLPKPKIPHFIVSGGKAPWGFGGKGSLPKISIQWYKEGAIFLKPTMFATPYGMKGVGEAGAEAVLPIDKLEGYVSNAVEKSLSTLHLDSLAYAMERLAERPVELNINGRRFAYATAGDTDGVNGMRSTFRSRGLALE